MDVSFVACMLILNRPFLLSPLTCFLEIEVCAMSPIVYAQFGCTLVKGGDVELGYRLGTLALRLLDKVKAQRYTSSVISLVGGLISWVK